MPADGFVAVLVIDLHFPDAGSLKARRRALAPVRARLEGRLGCSVAETALQDRWQRARLVAALAGTTAGQVTEAADRVERWLHGSQPDGVRVERLTASVEDLRR